ncbi:hypothetical protein [Aggregatibacter segnis]|nr:hypothetical protein [Aggregatibacter segnis]
MMAVPVGRVRFNYKEIKMKIMPISYLIKNSRYKNLSIEDIVNNDILLLPENLLIGSNIYRNIDSFVNAQDMSLLKKYLISHTVEKNVTIATLKELDPNISIDTISRHSSSSEMLWLGTIIITDIVLPIFINVISDLIKDKINKKENTCKNVNASIYIRENESIKEINYDGDGETLIKVLKEINREKSK